MVVEGWQRLRKGDWNRGWLGLMKRELAGGGRGGRWQVAGCSIWQVAVGNRWQLGF